MLEKLKQKAKKGFTVVELLVIVAIIAILAAIGIPALLKFVRKSKSAEASVNIKQINDGAVTWFTAEHTDSNGSPLNNHFPTSASPNGIVSTDTTVPNKIPCSDGVPLYARSSARWQSQPWKSLKFAINRSHYFRYRYATNGDGRTGPNPGPQNQASFTSIANADLDCDKVLSTFLSVSTFNPITGEVERGNIIITDAIE